MTKKIAVIFSLLVAMAPSLRGETHSGTGYTIDYKKWFKSSYPGLDAMFLAPSNTAGTYHENITIVITPYPYKAVSDWNAIRDSQVGQLKGMIQDFTLKSWSRVKVGKEEGARIVYAGKYGMNSLVWTQYSFLKNGSWYTVSYVGDEGDYGKFEGEAADIINSIVFQ